jgi:hypothetical protein
LKVQATPQYEDDAIKAENTNEASSVAVYLFLHITNGPFSEAQMAI